MHTAALLLIALAATALAAPIDIKEIEITSNNGHARAGYGIVGTEAYDGTLVIERFGQKNGLDDTDPEHAALYVRSGVGSASAIRAVGSPGGPAVIAGNGLPASTDFNPSGTGFEGSAGRPALFVSDGGNLNTNGQKNGDTRVTRVAAEFRGAVKMCGKSGSSGPECTNSAYIFLKDGTNELVVRFPNGVTKVIANGNP